MSRQTPSIKRSVCLLRGINVGGHRKMRMADLKDLFEDLGYGDVRTYLQSGNVVFQGKGPPSAQAAGIRTAISDHFGQEVGVLVLTGNDFLSLRASNPLLKDPGLDAGFLHVTFLFDGIKAPVDPAKIPVSESERAVVHKGHYFLHCPDGYGRTKINNSWFERALKQPATTRNWKTVNALANMLTD